MKYYIDTVEVVKGAEENTLNEYGKREAVVGENAALSKYFRKLSDTSADIGVNHYYLGIKLSTSQGAVIKKEEIGTYIDELPPVVTPGE